MNDQTQGTVGAQQAAPPCIPDEHGRCLTCSDEALPATVLRLNPAEWTAEVELNGERTEVDIMLVEDVAVGTRLLVHAGVALGRLEESG